MHRQSSGILKLQLMRTMHFLCKNWKTLSEKKLLIIIDIYLVSRNISRIWNACLETGGQYSRHKYKIEEIELQGKNRSKIDKRNTLSCNNASSRGLSGYWACWRVADSQRPVLMAGLSLNWNRRPWTNSPTTRCYVWLALIRVEGVNGTWVI
jgi:hypothetical protein